MQRLDRQLCEFVPRGLLEALSWYWACGDYTFSDALQRRPFEVAPAQIRRCRKLAAVRFGSVHEQYIVDFTQTRHNRISTSRLPPGFPARRVEAGDPRRYLVELVMEQAGCLPRSMTAWWAAGTIVAVLLVRAASPTLAPLLMRAPGPGCGADCAAMLAQIDLARAAGLVPALLGLLLPLRVGSVLANPGLSPALRALTRFEIVMLPTLGAVALALSLQPLRTLLGH